MKKYILTIWVVFITAGFFSSCSEDEFTDSIFDTTYHPLDRTSYSFPLDTFLIENYLTPYNLRYLYKMEDIGADMQYNLVPCKYEKGKDVATLAKYLWFDVYAKLAGQEFLKIYAPRILHIIGSPAYNASSGTMTLGEAAGGKKITFYRGNSIDPANLEDMNEKFFKTMHHEFAHILHQNIIYPTSFRTLSSGNYDPFGWQDRPDSLVLSLGFATPYGSSQITEDWVEVIANYIVKDQDTWDGMLNAATFDWEVVMVDKADYKENADKEPRYYRTYKKDVTAVGSSDTIQYEIFRKIVTRDEQGNVVYDADGKLSYVHNDAVDGRELLLKKLDLCRTWLIESFGIDLDQLRAEVQKRQYLTDEAGNFVKRNNKYVNRLMEPLHSGSSVTLMDSLRNDIDKFKELQKVK